MTQLLFSTCDFIMNRLTLQQRFQIIEICYQNSCCGKTVFRKERPFYDYGLFCPNGRTKNLSSAGTSQPQ